MTMLVFEQEGVPVVTTSWTVIPNTARSLHIFYLANDRIRKATLPIAFDRFLHIVRDGDVADLRGET